MGTTITVDKSGAENDYQFVSYNDAINNSSDFLVGDIIVIEQTTGGLFGIGSKEAGTYRWTGTSLEYFSQSLKDEIKENEDNLTQEISDRQTQYNLLQNQIQSVESDNIQLQNDLSQEILDRTNADNSINNDIQQLKTELPLYISNNSGQIKLNWSTGNEPSTVNGFSSNTPNQIILNNSYTVSSFPTTTYPYLASNSIGGENVIDPSTLFLRELKEGQSILFRVKVGYFNKGAGQNGRFSVKMYNPNPASSFEIIKSLPTPDGVTTLEQELEFIVIADSLSLDLNYGYAFEVQSTFNDVNMVGYISSITAFYMPIDLFNK